MIKVEEIRKLKENMALKLQRLMPQIILDYVNNNEVVQLQDCQLVADSLLLTALSDLYVDTGELTDEEQDDCVATKEQLESYMAEPDDEVAAKIRVEHPNEFVMIAKGILYGSNIAKAARAKFKRIGDVL